MTLRIGGAAAAWMVMARLACAQTSPVPTLIRDVAPGSGALVVRADGSVVTWGSSPQGILQVPTVLVLPGPAQRVAVCGSNLGRFTGYAVLENGTVVAWGANDEGQLGIGAPGADVSLGTYPKPSVTPVRVTGLADVVDIAAGDRHVVALRRDGTVWAWGTREDGALGGGDVKPKGGVRVLSASAPVRVHSLVGVTQIAVAARHSLALTSDGHVFAWGANRAGELGNGGRETGWTPTLVPGLDHVVAIAAGNGGNSNGVSGALRDDGTVWTWGVNDSAMIGNSASVSEPDDGSVLHAVPEQMRGITAARKLDIGGGHVAVGVGRRHGPQVARRWVVLGVGLPATRSRHPWPEHERADSPRSAMRSRRRDGATAGWDSRPDHRPLPPTCAGRMVYVWHGQDDGLPAGRAQGGPQAACQAATVQRG